MLLTETLKLKKHMELKRRMTVEEMACHMAQHTARVVNRVTVGRYARSLGYKVYKPMIKGKIHLFYIREEPSGDFPPGKKSETVKEGKNGNR